MKLIRFVTNNTESSQFGLVINGNAVAFSVLQRKAVTSHESLADSQSYLQNLPASETAARSLQNWAEQHFDEFEEGEAFALETVQLKEPVEVTALFDFGLTQRHLKNSLVTLLKYEGDNPQTGPILHAVGNSLIEDKTDEPSDQSEHLSYYKCNMNSIVGDKQTIPWPLYTSRLDIEPELAVVYGNPEQPVAGYCVFNDISARDVQAPEFIGGFCLTKDMTKGNQLGPFLVTLDEVGDPYDLEVSVKVNGEGRFEGSTSEIGHHAEAVFDWIERICPLLPGSIMGFGTIPDCTGLDHDDFLDPGDVIEISIERLGTLHCSFAEPKANLAPSRWPVRDPLEKYTGDT